MPRADLIGRCSSPASASPPDWCSSSSASASSVTGRDEQNLPDAIEAIDPIRGATQVPAADAGLRRPRARLRGGADHRRHRARDRVARTSSAALGRNRASRSACRRRRSSSRATSRSRTPRSKAARSRSSTHGPAHRTVRYWLGVDGRGRARRLHLDLLRRLTGRVAALIRASRQLAGLQQCRRSRLRRGRDRRGRWPW